MNVRSTIALARMSLLFLLAESPCVCLSAARAPDYVGVIVLVGAIIIASPAGIVVSRALRGGLEDHLADSYRRLEWLFQLAAATSLIGVTLVSLHRPPFETVGMGISAVGMVVAAGLLVGSSGWRGRPGGRISIWTDGDRPAQHGDRRAG